MTQSIRSNVAALVLVLATLTLAAPAAAAVPPTVNFQGRLTTNDVPPVPVTGSLPIDFGIWDNQSGGVLLWGESHASVDLADGIFNLILGSVTAVPASIFESGAIRWLELTVDGEVLTPRQQLGSVGWAFQAEGSQALGGVAAAGWQQRISGTCAAGSSIQSVAGNGSVTCEVDDTGSGVPSGAVMYFNLLACPVGWTELFAARGRYIVGLPVGGTLLGTAGTALANVENRPVGQHTHSINDPGHAHTYTPPVQLGTGSGSSSAKVGSATQTSANVTGITINNSGAVAGTNAPYVQLLACQKN